MKPIGNMVQWNFTLGSWISEIKYKCVIYTYKYIHICYIYIYVYLSINVNEQKYIHTIQFIHSYNMYIYIYVSVCRMFHINLIMGLSHDHITKNPTPGRLLSSSPKKRSSSLQSSSANRKAYQDGHDMDVWWYC